MQVQATQPNKQKLSQASAIISTKQVAVDLYQLG
jgi:hypothetical protein